jgi:23S rRNA (cytidine1920-2'-O)/16S rRNA (cytidine1409-2'-O)-methyltransferase
VSVAVSRIDAELVRRGLARSRAQAGELVRAGRVSVGGGPARKPSQPVEESEAISVDPLPHHDDVGRGAAKLRGALADLDPGPVVEGARCLDVGAGTGGFTQVLLELGALHVIALDVGHAQLAPLLASDPRVEERSGTNIRDVEPKDLRAPVDLLVADLSFISLRLVLPALASLVRPGGDLVLLVKPQFEVGRQRLGSTGVVRSEHLRAESVAGVTAVAVEVGLSVLGTVTSRVPGTRGNLEAFLWARAPR